MNSLKISTNLSNEFQTQSLQDPINYKVAMRNIETSNQLAERFALKQREIKERDSLGGFRIPSDILVKRTNPSEEYQRSLELELQKKKNLLSSYDPTYNEYENNPLFTYSKNNFNNDIENGNTEINLNDLNLDSNVPANENLLKMIDAQVSLLKQQSNNQYNKLINSNPNFSKKQINYPFTIEEPSVATNFMAANDNRVQAVKHVQTKKKPEYMTLEELLLEKAKNEEKLLDIENEYYGRKKKSLEEIEQEKKQKQLLLERKKKLNRINRPGYNSNEPLDNYDKKYINKYENYLNKKNSIGDKFGYEEEWNTTKIKSQNANGVVNRKDGLSGTLDNDDLHKLYYYDISDSNKPLNFERPLLTHPHKGKESSVKRTFRNEPGYLDTMVKEGEKPNMYLSQTFKVTNPKISNSQNFYVTKGNDEPQNNFNNSNNNNNFNNSSNNNNFNNSNNNNNFNNSNNNNNNNLNGSNNINNNNYFTLNPQQSVNINGSNILGQSLNTQQINYIKMIFSMLNKNNNNEVNKQQIPNDMKLNDSMLHEMGFENINDFIQKLNDFPTNNNGFMNEEEFINFLLNKGENFNNNNTYNNTNNNNYEEEKNPIENSNNNFNNSNNNNNFYNTAPINKNNINIEEEEEDDNENLPGMSTTTMDFLKNPSTKFRLNALNKSLNKKPHSKSPNHNTSFNNINYSNNNNLRHNKSTSHLNFSQTFSKKNDLNFTIPKPFNFLKKNYHEKKLLKIQEILLDRQEKEKEVFNHPFHANKYNKKMFDADTNLGNIIERERIQRKARTDKLKEQIQANMKPFSFYSEDERKYINRINQIPQAPQFPKFKANPIQWKSQVNMYDGLINNSKKAREERTHARALETFNKAKLPPRMEMHEKQKKLQEQEKKLILLREEEEEKKKRLFKAKETPNFEKLQEQFMNNLDKRKKAAKKTVPKPFTFHEPKKKAELCTYLDFENDPNVKNPQKKKNIDQIIKNMQKKPAIEPATTKALTLLMETRRKEIEQRKKNEENRKIEDENRKIRQNRLKERVQGSKDIVDNRKELEEQRKKKQEDFINKLNDDKNKYMEILGNINQRVANRPLMLETIGKKKDMITMKQNMQKEIEEALKEAKRDNENNNNNNINNVNEMDGSSNNFNNNNNEMGSSNNNNNLGNSDNIIIEEHKEETELI